LVRQPVIRLMAGNGSSEMPESGTSKTRRRIWPVARIVLLVLVAIQCVAGFFLEGESKAGSFFGSGFTALVLLYVSRSPSPYAAPFPDAGLNGSTLDQLLTYPVPAPLNPALVAQRDSALAARERAVACPADDYKRA